MSFADASRCWGMPRWQRFRQKQLDGKSERIQHYFNAVYCWARAMLNERYQDYDATASGVKRGEELAEASGDLWRDARWAISRVQDAPHCTVELI
ncbi:phage head completion protein [Salmonella enterica]|nr:phage head completion protein [Salmonella enterica]